MTLFTVEIHLRKVVGHGNNQYERNAQDSETEPLRSRGI